MCCKKSFKQPDSLDEFAPNTLLRFFHTQRSLMMLMASSNKLLLSCVNLFELSTSRGAELDLLSAAQLLQYQHPEPKPAARSDPSLISPRLLTQSRSHMSDDRRWPALLDTLHHIETCVKATDRTWRPAAFCEQEDARRPRES